jgi:hypothetical protein
MWIPNKWFLNLISNNHNKATVCHTTSAFAIYMKKYLKAKEELWKLKCFTMQKYNVQKILSKEIKIFQDIITLQLISSFNTSQNIIFRKFSYQNRPGYIT